MTWDLALQIYLWGLLPFGALAIWKNTQILGIASGAFFIGWMLWPIFLAWFIYDSIRGNL